MQLKIIISDDGSHTLLAEEYGEHYHSTYGAIGESMHVYIENGLIPSIMKNNILNVLEIGFGTGLNAFLTLIEASNRKAIVKYTTFEPYPVENEIISQLNYPKLINNSSFQNDYYRMHQAEWNKMTEISPCFSILKINKKLQETDLTDNEYHVVYFDAFAPDIQPELWTAEVFSLCFRTMKNNSILMTYSAKGSVKRTLKSVGFKVENIKGPIGKREITKALKQ
jgi:tRNA U34 5-methylaminomethyl-2-thiouridine-forming methyltransferase MnmC